MIIYYIIYIYISNPSTALPWASISLYDLRNTTAAMSATAAATDTNNSKGLDNSFTLIRIEYAKQMISRQVLCYIYIYI